MSLLLAGTLASLAAGSWAAAPIVAPRPVPSAAPAGCEPVSARTGPGTAVAGAVGIAWGTTLTDGLRTHTVRAGESLGLIGARHGISTTLIGRDNGLDRNARLKPGQTLSIDARHIVPVPKAAPGSAGLPPSAQEADGPGGAAGRDAILVNVPQKMLFHLSEGRLNGAYPIGAGRPDWPTPRGAFTVVDLQVDKPWIVPPSIQREMAREGKEVLTRVEPGPDNPLGRHWIGLSIPGIGIHGTNAPASVYTLRSHGCIRLHPDDVAELHGRVSRGTAGEIVYHPVLIAGLPDGRVFIEAHPDAYRLAPDPKSGLRALADSRGLAGRIDWARVADVLRARDGIARDVTIGAAAPVSPPAREQESTRP